MICVRSTDKAIINWGIDIVGFVHAHLAFVCESAERAALGPSGHQWKILTEIPLSVLVVIYCIFLGC